MRMEYRAAIEVQPESEGKPKVYEVLYYDSDDLYGSAVACGLTAFYYGGWCWTYLFRPFSSDKRQFMQQAQARLEGEFGDRYSLHISEVNLAGWSDQARSFSYKELSGGLDDYQTVGERQAEFMKSQQFNISMDTTQYVSSSIAGSFIGFGLGHKMQNRWLKSGWKFSLMTGILFARYTLPWLSCVFGHEECNRNELKNFVLLMSAVKIWESIDLWVTPVQFAGRYYATGYESNYKKKKPGLALGLTFEIP